MKKIISVIMTPFILICILFCQPTDSIATVPAVAQFLPYTYNGITYTDVFIIEQPLLSRTLIFYYNVDNESGHIIAADNNGFGTTYINTTIPCHIPDVACTIIRDSNTPTSFLVGYYYPFGSYYGNYYPESVTSSYIITSQPIYDSSNSYVLMEANWASGQTRELNITRSPELGGGVSDYPTGENILCGIDSYEICEASFPFNTKVTLDAQHNEGYAFSHWEINDLAMADVDGSIDVTMSESKDVVAVFKPVFGFPLNGFTSTNVPISAVMDHSLSGGFYTTDGRNSEVEAFNGLIANGTQHSYNGNVYCYDTTNTNPFPGLNYIYTYPLENRSEICYDEHPGFDFAVVNGTNVLAPFAGRLYWATTDPINGNPGTYGTFYIDHGNGYTTWYLHCSGLTQAVVDEIALNGYAEVTKGQHIAESSNKGTTAYHLHFEVRKDGVDDEHVIDPYGWELWEE